MVWEVDNKKLPFHFHILIQINVHCFPDTRSPEIVWGQANLTN